MAQAVNYVLLKYSRSYSSSDPARFSTQPTSSDSEWQHFANPKLQLFLGNASPTSSFCSARIKIVWVPAGGELQHMQQENLSVLEDIDLSSFSLLSIDPQKTHSQSPPLKVVYRDSVVGFRYLHPRVVPPGALPTFRRFQICFTDRLLATQLVDSIRHVCPCKASPPAALAQSRTRAVTAHVAAASGTVLQANNTHLSTESVSVVSQHASRMLHLSTSALVNDLPNQSLMLSTNDQAIQNNTDGSGLPLCGPRTSPLNTVVVAASHMDRSIQVSQTTDTPFPLPTSIAASSAHEPYNTRGQPNPDQSDFHTCISHSAVSAGSSDPSSRSENSTQRYVTSSIDTLVDAPSTTPNLTCSEANPYNCNLNEKLSAASQAAAPPECLRDLCSIKELCGLSMEQLEQLVGEVIREPEFLTMLEKFDAMWKVKGIITRASNEPRY